MYCPVSRAAVYKRLKEGQLSIFLFHVTHRKTTLFGKNKILRENPYGYIPVSEARAWRQELEERAVKQGSITEEELEGARPDWAGDFLQWKNKWERGPGLEPGDISSLGLHMVKSLVSMSGLRDKHIRTRKVRAQKRTK